VCIGVRWEFSLKACGSPSLAFLEMASHYSQPQA
jgi:hypothetical protein